MISNENETSQPNSSKGPSSKLEAECLQHMAVNGCSLHDELIADGCIRRYSSDGKKSQPDEWYVCNQGHFVNGRPFLICTYGSWSGGPNKFTYKSFAHETGFSKEEMQKLKEEAQAHQKHLDEEMKKEREERLKYARDFWDQASQESAVIHPYLDRKKVQPYGVKFSKNANGNEFLVIPIQNVKNEIQAIQLIREDGDKRIHGLKKSNFHVIGQIRENSRIIVAEGYATGASIYEARGDPIVIAFDCGNLDPVIAVLRNKFPKHRITIAADDDVDSEGNPGKTKAEVAAKKYQCDMILPKFPENFRLPNGKRATDFNDVHVYFGLNALRLQFPKKKTHLKTVDVDQFLKMNLPPRKFLLSPWLPEQGLVMIYASRGIGKTFIALTIACAVASGEQIFGWEVPEPRKVLYIDGEMPAVAMQERIAKIVRSFNKEFRDPSFFKLITPDLQEKGIRDLSTKEGQLDINDHLDDVDLVVLDNISTLVRTGNENEAESWCPIQEWALEQRKRGKSVLFIHHAGKTGASSRGTSKREDVLDTVIALRRPKDYVPADGAKFEVHFEKARGFDGDAAAPFEASLVTDENGAEKWVFEGIAGRELEQIAELHNEGLNQREIAKEMNKSLGFVNKKIKQARAEGLIK